MTDRTAVRLFWLCLPLPFLTGAFAASAPPGARWSPLSPDMVDLQVIIGASDRLLIGDPLYLDQPIPFSMPPAVAMAAIPLSIIGATGAQLLWILLTAALVTWLSGTVLARGLGLRKRSPWVPVAAALVIGLAVPVRDNFALGQITVLIACLIVADLTGPRTGLGLPRGLLTGIATACATAGFVVIVALLISRRHRDAGIIATLSAALFTSVAWLLTPVDSALFWSVTLTGGHLAESNAYLRPNNGSVPAIATRALGEGTAAADLSFVVCILILAAGLVTGTLLIRRGDHLVGVLTTAVSGLTIMPLAFPHAWVLVVVLAAVVLSGSVGSARYRPSWQFVAALLGLWVAVSPSNQIDSALVATGTTALISAWLLLVGSTLWSERRRASQPQPSRS